MPRPRPVPTSSASTCSPLPGGEYTILELNGAVDFDNAYALDAEDVYARGSRSSCRGQRPLQSQTPVRLPVSI